MEGERTVTIQQGQGACEKLGQNLGRESCHWVGKREWGGRVGTEWRAKLDFIPGELDLKEKLQPVSIPGKELMSTKPKCPSSLGRWKFPNIPVKKGQALHWA